jgi:hypothetical protein
MAGWCSNADPNVIWGCALLGVKAVYDCKKVISVLNKMTITVFCKLAIMILPELSNGKSHISKYFS